MIEEITEVDRSLGVARDFDVLCDGSWVGVFQREDGVYIAHSDGREFRLKQSVRYPVVRALNRDRVIVLDARKRSNTPGAFLFSADGKLDHAFSAGDGIQDVVVLGDLIAVTYFDEGVFGDFPPSEQGIAFFDFQGQLFAGYQALFGSRAVRIVDCYSACRVDPQTLAFSAYTGFPLVRVHPRTSTQEVVELPRRLHGASALCVRGDLTFFFSPYDRIGVILSWQPGAKPKEVARHPGHLRGLEDGRFLAVGEHGFTVLHLL